MGDILHSSTAFLTEIIEQAFNRHQVGVSKPAKIYLIEMLQRFFYTPLAHDEPITFQFQRIHQETCRLRQQQLQRELGDHCLFSVGYFYDFVRQKGSSNVCYYSQIGSTAYREVGKHPFTEISGEFENFYLVIGDLHLPELDKEEKVMGIYEKWLKTDGDKYYESLLLGKGIIPQNIKLDNN